MNDNFNLKGKMKIITSKDNEVVRETPFYNNLIVNGTDTGFNLILDRLYGTNTYTLNITHLDIGTAITTPALSDTVLGAPVARTAVATRSLVGDEITFRFFFADADLTNGSYNEVGLFVDGTGTVSTGKMFSHALFGSTFLLKLR